MSKKYTIMFSHIDSNQRGFSYVCSVHSRLQAGQDIMRVRVPSTLKYGEMSVLCDCVQKMHNTTDLDLETIVDCCLL